MITGLSVRGCGSGRARAHTYIFTRSDAQTGLAVGFARLVVRGASPLEIVFHLMRTGLETDADGPRYLRSNVLEAVNDHHHVVRAEMKVDGTRRRTFLCSLVFKKVSDAPPSYLWVAAPLRSHRGINPKDERHAVRGELTRCIRLTAVASNVTHLEYACRLDLKGHTSKRLAQKVVVPEVVRVPHAIQLYFLQTRPASDCKAVDGAFIGALLVDAVKQAMHERLDVASTCAKFVERTEVLQCEFEHIAGMFTGMLDRKYRRRQPVVVDEPEKLNELQASTIGRSIRSLLLVHTAPSEAVDEALRTFPALGKMDERHEWFRPMMESIVTPLLSASIGSRVRLVLSSLLGLLDIASNVATVCIFHIAGRHSAGLSILSLVVVSNAVKIYFSFLDSKQRGRVAMATDALLVVTSLKPAVDLYKKMRGRDQSGAADESILGTSAVTALVMGSDVLFVAVPTSIIKLVDVIRSQSWSMVPCLSIVLSWLVVAANMCALTCMLDLDQEKRRLDPDFYGLLPLAKWRLRCIKAALFVFYLAHVVCSTLGAALLFVANSAWLPAQLCAETSSYLLVKALRGEARYWIPGLPLPMALFLKAFTKVCVDFTACAQLRNPLDLGGATWMASVVLRHGVCLLSGWIYCSGDDASAAVRLECSYVVGFLGAGSAISALALVVFLLAIERKYVQTFISFESGMADKFRRFRSYDGDDFRRFNTVFFTTEQYIAAFRTDVAVWVEASYSRWKQEPWFTEKLLAQIPDDMLPKAMVYDSECFAETRIAARIVPSLLQRPHSGLAPTVSETHEKMLQLAYVGVQTPRREIPASRLDPEHAGHPETADAP